MTIADGIRYWANRKAKADAMPAAVRERYSETYKAVCTNLQKLMDAIFHDAVAVIDKSMDKAQIDHAAAVMDACISSDALRAADAAEKYNMTWPVPLGFVDVASGEMPEGWRENEP